MLILIQIWASKNSINNFLKNCNLGSKLVETIVLMAECNAILMDWGTPFTMPIVDISGNMQSIHPDIMTPVDTRMSFHSGR
jgi:hypothetical protein